MTQPLSRALSCRIEKSAMCSPWILRWIVCKGIQCQVSLQVLLEARYSFFDPGAGSSCVDRKPDTAYIGPQGVFQGALQVHRQAFGHTTLLDDLFCSREVRLQRDGDFNFCHG